MVDVSMLSALEALAKRGIYTESDASDTFALARIVTDADCNDLGYVDGFRPRSVVRDHVVLRIVDELLIKHRPTDWTIENDPPLVLGGYSGDGFLVTVPTVEDIIQITTDYYFGEARTLDGWKFPIHRHPNWNWKLVLDAYSHPLELSWDEWIQQARQRVKQMDQVMAEWVAAGESTASPPNLSPLQFYEVRREPPGGPILQLRCDCRQIIIVTGERL